MRISEFAKDSIILGFHEDCNEAGIDPAKEAKFLRLRFNRQQAERQEEREVRGKKRELRVRVRQYYAENPDFRGNSEELAANLNVDPADIHYNRLTASMRYQQRLLALTDQRDAAE